MRILNFDKFSLCYSTKKEIRAGVGYTVESGLLDVDYTGESGLTGVAYTGDSTKKFSHQNQTPRCSLHQ
jgi:hypothetical protein